MAGEILKKRREELGVDIKEASDTLKIGSEYLSAIENDLFDKLPVAVYTIGYIRCYAKYLDVDAEPVISGFMSHLASPKPSTIIPVSSSRRKAPVSFYAILLLLAGVLAFAVYTSTREKRNDGITTEKMSPSLKGENLLPAAPPAMNSTSEKRHAEKSPEADKVNESLPAVTHRTEHQLAITASDTVWVRIKFENGKVEDMLLRSGISKSWKFEGQAVMRIGNAGGITLKFDGEDLGAPGKSGQVLDLTFPKS